MLTMAAISSMPSHAKPYALQCQAKPRIKCAPCLMYVLLLPITDRYYFSSDSGYVTVQRVTVTIETGLTL